MWATRTLIFVIFVLCLATAQQTRTYVAHSLEPFSGAQVYKDPHSGTLLYVESDGRHVAAISGNGKLLWIKDAHEGVPSYRTEKPQIVYIGPVPKWDPSVKGERDKFAAITFNNSQFGYLRISNGEFQFVGQD